MMIRKVKVNTHVLRRLVQETSLLVHDSRLRMTETSNQFVFCVRIIAAQSTMHHLPQTFLVTRVSQRMAIQPAQYLMYHSLTLFMGVTQMETKTR